MILQMLIIMSLVRFLDFRSIEMNNHSIIVLTRGAGGLYWLVPAIVISFIKAILDAWVLLVEINR